MIKNGEIEKKGNYLHKVLTNLGPFFFETMYVVMISVSINVLTSLVVAKETTPSFSCTSKLLLFFTFLVTLIAFVLSMILAKILTPIFSAHSDKILRTNELTNTGFGWLLFYSVGLVLCLCSFIIFLIILFF